MLAIPCQRPGELGAVRKQLGQAPGDRCLGLDIAAGQGAVGIAAQSGESTQAEEAGDLACQDHKCREHAEAKQAGGKPADPVVALQGNRDEAGEGNAGGQRGKTKERRHQQRAPGEAAAAGRA